MSFISTFWTLDRSKVGELLSESKPYARKMGKKPLFPFIKQKTEMVYPWFDYLNDSGKKEDTYGLSGMVMIDFDQMLMESSLCIFDLALPQSSQFSEYCGGSAAIIDFEGAQSIIKNINEAAFAEKDVAEFYDEDNRPGNLRFKADDILSTGEHIKQWCSKVATNKIGVLIIG